MKRWFPLALAVALAIPGSARAQNDVTFADGDQIRLQSVSGAQVASWGGVYLGPYTGSFGPATPQFTMYCVDYYHHVTVGQTWNINESNLGGAAPDISQTRLGSGGPPVVADPLGVYRQSAYLSSLFGGWASLGSVSFDGGATTFASRFGSNWNQRTAWSGIHAAIWSITSNNAFDASVPGAVPYALPFIQYAAAQAANGYAGTGVNFDEWSVLTARTSTGAVNTATNSPQEFIVRTTVTPEPETYLLLATGLLFLVGLGRKRIRNLGDA